MPETQNLGLPLVEQAQAQKHVTVNESLIRLDGLVQLSLASTDGTVPPSSPADGEVHAIGTGATGAWSGNDGRLAVFANGGWVFVDAAPGWRGWSVAGQTSVQFDGTDWIEGVGSMSANGAGFVHRTAEIDHGVSSGATSMVVGAIPANVIVYGVTGRVLSDIGGAASLELGVSGATNRYGSGIGTATGAWLRGITGSPLAYYSATDLVLTASGGGFDGTGSIRLAVHFAELTLPRA
ncbi:MAG: DUF2793 domain-containing protein [Paracoccaceae bacterium]|nr:DUF2793 domain-containing protein [Paracoccaceae bacterium]